MRKRTKVIIPLLIKSSHVFFVLYFFSIRIAAARKLPRELQDIACIKLHNVPKGYPWQRQKDAIEHLNGFIGSVRYFDRCRDRYGLYTGYACSRFQFQISSLTVVNRDLLLTRHFSRSSEAMVHLVIPTEVARGIDDRILDGPGSHKELCHLIISKTLYGPLAFQGIPIVRSRRY